MKSDFVGIKDGFNFIKVEDFDFIQTCLDFIVNEESDFIKNILASIMYSKAKQKNTQ